MGWIYSKCGKRLVTFMCMVIVFVVVAATINAFSDGSVTTDGVVVFNKSIKDKKTDTKVSNNLNDQQENVEIKIKTNSEYENNRQYENNRGIVTEFTEEEYAMFVAIIFCEVGAESYETKLGVANVVLNRLHGNVYPNTLREVLYQNMQFELARTGRLEQRISEYKNGEFTTTNHLECIEAANEAMAGHNNVGDRIGFLTPQMLEELFGGQYRDKLVIGNVAFFNA